MRISQVVENINRCKQYESMLDGINHMVKNAPDSDKKEMLLDIFKFGKKITERFQRFNGSNEYLQNVNFELEIKLRLEKRKVQELEELVKNLKRGI